MIRCSTLANTARSTSKPKRRPRSAMRRMFTQQVASHSAPNNSAGPMERQRTSVSRARLTSGSIRRPTYAAISAAIATSSTEQNEEALLRQ